jgi:DNA-directed RNA polymerase I, II, and III subunit RPABC1
MEEDSLPLYRVYINTLDMLEARGYMIPPSTRKTPAEYADQFCSTLEDTNVCFVHRERLMMQFTMRDNRSKCLRVIFFSLPTDKTVGVAPLRTIMSTMMGEERTCALIILPHGNELTAASRKLVAEMNTHIQCMMESELSINVSRMGRNRYCVYRVLPEGSTEKARWKKRFTGLASRGDRSYGVIDVKDPMARYYGLQRGDVLAGCGSSESAGRYTTFRICGEVMK